MYMHLFEVERPFRTSIERERERERERLPYCKFATQKVRERMKE